MADVDPVVREIPVLLATELSDVIYLIQHPLFSKKRVDLGNPTMSGLGEPPLPASAKIRPRHGKLELTTSMVTGYGDDPHFDNECSDRQRIADHVFASSEVKMQAHFVCGAMRGGALHLTPVRRVLQVRPSFHHVDRADDKEAQMEALGAQNYRDEADDMDDDGGGDSGGGGAAAAGKAKSKAAAAGKPPPPPPASSSAGFARRESEHAKAARLKSWAYQQSSELSEAFVTLDVHGSDSAESAHEWDRLFADQALGPKEKTSGEGVGCGRGGGGSNGSGQHLTRRQLQGEGAELEYFSCPAPFSIATLLGKGGFGAVKVEAEKESSQRASQQKSSHSKNSKNMKKQIGDFDSDDDGDGEVGGLTLASRRHSLSKESLCVLAARASALVAGASGGGGRAKAESLVFSDGEEEEEEEENEGGEDDDRDGLKDSDDEFEGDGRFGSSSSRGRVKDEEGGDQLGADKEGKAARRARRARRRRQWAQMLNSAGPLNLGTAASSDIGGGSGGSGGGRRDPSFGGLDHASRVFCFAAAHALVEEFGRPATLAAAASELNLQLNSNFNSDSNSLNSDSTSLQGSSSTLSSRQQHSSSGMLQGNPAPIPYSALSALAHAAAAFNSSSSSSSAVGGGSVGITASLLLDCLAWFSLLFPQAGSPFRGAATYNYLSDGSAVSGGGTVKPKVPTAAAPPSAAAAAAGARSRVLGGKGGGGGGGDEGAVGRSRDERGLEASAAALSAAVAGAKEQQDQWRREKEGGAGGDDAFSALVASSSSSGIVAPGEGWWTSAAASGRKGAGSSGRGVVPWGGAEEDGDAAGTQGAYRGLTTFQAAVAKVLQNEAYAGSLLHAAFTLEALEGELLPSAHALADLEGAAPVSSSSRGMDDDDDLDSQSKSQSKAGAPKASVVASLSHAILRRCSVVPVGLVASLVQTALTNFHASPAASGAQGRGSGGSKGLDAGLDAGTTTAGAAANDVINTEADDVAVLVAAERFGVVVRGNWVVRSEVLYCAQGGGGRNAMLEFVGLGDASSSSSAASSRGCGGGGGCGGGKGGGGRSGGAGAARGGGGNGPAVGSFTEYCPFALNLAHTLEALSPYRPALPNSSKANSSKNSSQSKGKSKFPSPSSVSLGPVEKALCNARDTVLALLERDGFLYRLPLTAALRDILNSYQVRSVLGGVAFLDRPTRRWSLSRPDASHAFEHAFPSEAHAFANHWKALAENGSGGGAFESDEDEEGSRGGGAGKGKGNHAKGSKVAGGSVRKLVEAYDEARRQAEEEGGAEALGKSTPPRVAMIDAQPGFRPGTTGGRFY